MNKIFLKLCLIVGISFAGPIDSSFYVVPTNKMPTTNYRVANIALLGTKSEISANAGLTVNSTSVKFTGSVSINGTLSANSAVFVNRVTANGLYSGAGLTVNAGNLYINAGNVGIGVTGPSTKLEVAGTISMDAGVVNTSLTFRPTTLPGAGQISEYTNGYLYARGGTGGALKLMSTDQGNTLELNDTNTIFEVQGSVAGTWTSTGLGIGATAPSTKLEVAGTVSASALQVNGFAGIDSLDFVNASSATIANGSVTIDSTIGIITGEGGLADDLSTLVFSGTLTGKYVVAILKPADNTHDLTVKNGVGNIFCGADRVLAHGVDKITLLWDPVSQSWSMLSVFISGL